MKNFSPWVMSLILMGCTASPVPHNRDLRASSEKPREATTAISSVVGAVSGQKVDEKTLRELSEKIKKDPETQTAVQAVAESFKGGKGDVKYCPVDGKRFHVKFLRCPEHDVLLKTLEE